MHPTDQMDPRFRGPALAGVTDSPPEWGTLNFSKESARHSGPYLTRSDPGLVPIPHSECLRNLLKRRLPDL